MNFAALGDDWRYLLLGTFPEGPPGGALLSLIVCLAIGFFNGYMVMRTGIPSFLITLGTFFVLQGANLGVTKLVTGSVSSRTSTRWTATRR